MSSRKRKIIQLTLDNQFICYWYGVQEASDSIGVPRKGITAVLTGRAKSSFGYKWIYDFDLMEGEEWRRHPIYNLYGSNYGRIKLPSGRKTFGHKTRSGYCTIGIPISNIHKMVHRIIIECWFGIIPDKMQVDHLDKIRDNNYLTNLEIVTVKENNARKNKK